MSTSKLILTPLIGLAVSAALILAACGDDAPEAAPQQAQQQQAQQAAEPEPQQQAEPAAQAQAAQQQSASTAQAEATTEPAEQQEQPADTPDDGIVYDPNRDTLIEGERLGSSILAADEVKQYRFAAEAGEWLRISVDGRDGMDPVLTLLEPDRTDVASNDDRSATNRDSLLVVRVPTAGDQVIRVGAFDGASLGDFVIQVERITIGDDADSAIVGIGSPVTAHLDFPTDVDAFEFTGQIGQTVTIRVDGDIGVDVYAQLIDPVGDLIASDDDSGHGLDAEISLTLTTAGSHRVEVWGALNLEGQRQLIGSYSVLVQDGPPTAPLEGDTASDTAGVALTFLDALRQGDSATLLALAGPEALTTWGWETTADVERDLLKMQSIGLGSGALQTISRIDALYDRRSRVFIQLSEADWLRFELVLIGGLWTVDFWSHQSSAPGLTDQPADVPTDDTEAAQEESSE